jgi:hypothetical protein
VRGELLDRDFSIRLSIGGALTREIESIRRALQRVVDLVSYRVRSFRRCFCPCSKTGLPVIRLVAEEDGDKVGPAKKQLVVI